MHVFHNHLLAELKKASVVITEIAFCPHAPEDGCDCRKPSPKLLNQLCDKFDIDPKLSFMIGDKESDVIAGQNANMTSIGLNCKAENSVKSLNEILAFL